jgi:protein involved in polysaccharide export with SLBB domain
MPSNGKQAPWRGLRLKRKCSLQSISVSSACRFARNGVRALLSTATKLVAVSLVLVPAAWAGEYQLGVQDKLRIRVVEWQTIEGTFREWDAVSGEYTVGMSGELSLPLIGDTPAAGKTTAEVAAAISETLEQKFGLSTKPEASVELAEYRPFFISGDVQSPGQYPYVPDLTVVKAVSIGGGTKRSGVQRAERDYINAKGNFVPVIGKSGTLAQGATPIVIWWDYNALSGRDALNGNPPVEVVVPKTGVVAGVYVQAISAYAPHPNAAKLWMEYLYSDEGQLGWLKGYCHPIRFNAMAAAGKIPQELLDKLPPAEAYEAAVFPTLDQQDAAKQVITGKWDAVVGANVQ